MSLSTKIATVPFLGKSWDVYLDKKQWKNFKWNGQSFSINSKTQSNFELLNKEFDLFCRDQLKKIIDREISKLRTKKILTELEYSDGVKNFSKKVNISVNDFLSEIGFSSKLKYEIGNYQREWGINQINPKKKEFTLFFNQNLIKYDEGPHIEYVVAHELTHVFHRNHDSLFQDALSKLFPRKRSSEEFFKNGISNRFRLSKSSNPISFWLIFGLMIIFLVLFAWEWVLENISNFFGLRATGGKF